MAGAALKGEPMRESPGSATSARAGRRRLLESDEPEPVRIERPAAHGPFLLTCDHAGNRIPRRLGTLGLTAADLERHIAWDIGVAEMAAMMAERLDAVLIMQNYSRLVIDCNRPPGSPGAIVPKSESTIIPGNLDVSPAEADLRRDEIFEPYHESIASELDRRQSAGRPSLLIAVHSFTPVYHGRKRAWHAGVLFNRDPRLALRVLDLLRRDRTLVIGENEPYSLGDTTDYTIPLHGERRGLPHVELEVRQDLLAGPEGRIEWAARFSDILIEAWAALDVGAAAWPSG